MCLYKSKSNIEPPRASTPNFPAQTNNFPPPLVAGVRLCRAQTWIRNKPDSYYTALLQSGDTCSLASLADATVWRVVSIHQSGKVRSLASLADATVWQSGITNNLAIFYRSGDWFNLAILYQSSDFQIVSPRNWLAPKSSASQISPDWKSMEIGCPDETNGWRQTENMQLFQSGSLAPVWPDWYRVPST